VRGSKSKLSKVRKNLDEKDSRRYKDHSLREIVGSQKIGVWIESSFWVRKNYQLQLWQPGL
jgi:hypothetical protein